MTDPIARRSRVTPGKLALRHTAADLTYAAFERRIESVAGFLAQRSLKRGSLAAVCVFSSLDGWVIGLALRRLGITTLAIANASELATYGIRGVSYLVVSGTETPSARDATAAPPVIRVPLESLAGDGPPPAAWGTRAAGHIVFTSGATGAPKQILVDDATLAAHLDQRGEAFGLTESTVCNLFDWGLWSSIGYLVPLKVWEVGGTIVLRQPGDFGPTMIAASVTTAIATPVMLAQMLARSPPAARLDKMRLFVGGGPLPPPVAADALARLTKDLHVLVGSTEAGVWAVTPISKPEDVAAFRPLPNRVVQVVSDAGEPLPAGEVGHVRIDALPGVEAYRDDPAASRVTFRDGYVYSGDLGVIGPDGRLQFRGRVSDVVVRMNQKIAPEPLEALIASRLGAIDACVFSADTGEISEELHVALVPGREHARGELEALARELAGFPKVHFHFVSELPRNDRGKLQRFLVRRQFLGA